MSDRRFIPTLWFLSCHREAWDIRDPHRCVPRYSGRIGLYSLHASDVRRYGNLVVRPHRLVIGRHAGRGVLSFQTQKAGGINNQLFHRLKMQM